MRKTLVAAALATLAPMTAAAGESFTFVSRNDIQNRIVAPVAGSKTIVAQFSTGEIEAAYPTRKILSKSQCATWPAPPGGMFTTNGACRAVDNDGSEFTVVVACRATNEKGTANDCFGQLTGINGVYQGKTGTVSWRGVLSDDSKRTTATGTGIWN